MLEIKLRETGIGDDRHAETFLHSVEIVGDDGRALYTLALKEDGSLEIYADGFTKHGGKLLTGQLNVRPRSTNIVLISRDVYQP